MAVAGEEVVNTYVPPIPDNLEAVFIVSKKGAEVIDAVVAKPSPPFNISKVAKYVTVLTSVAEGVVKELSNDVLEELRIEAKGRVVIVINDGDYVRVGVASK